VVINQCQLDARETAGPVWYLTLCDPALHPGATFAQFARLTLKHAQRNYGRTSTEADAVRAGWEAVKIPV
jgi:Zn-dependent metalloprotease